MENPNYTPPMSMTHDYEVMSYHCDPYANLRVSALCIFLQEIAWLHSDKMHIGWKDLMTGHNCFWALSRLKVRMIDPPKWGDIITIKTWSRGTDSIQFFRDWQVFDQQGNLCAVASSIWVIVNADTRHAIRNQILAERFPLQGDKVFAEKLRKIKAPTNPHYSDYSVIRYSELDINHHMNNVSYLTRFLDEETSEFRAKHRIHEAELNFLLEATGDTFVRVGRQITDDNNITYNITRKGDDAELCRGKVSWLPREQSSAV